MNGRKLHVPLLAILLLAAVVRGGFLYKYWDNLDFAPSFLLHGEVARNILHGHWFQTNPDYLQAYVRDCYNRGKLIDLEDYPPPTQETYAPLYDDEGGYGLLLAAIWKLTGSYRWWYVRVLQIVLDVLMCWLVYRIGKGMFGQRVGLLAAFVYACFIPGIELAVRPHRDIWVTFLYIFTVHQLVQSAENRKTFWRMLTIGVATGAVAWMRSTVLLFVILLPLLLLVTHPRRKAVVSSAVLVASFVLALSPLVIRNYVVFDKFMATRGAFWHSFWGGVGQMPNPYNLQEDDQEIVRFAQSIDSTARLDTDHYEQVLKRQALTYVNQHPMLYAESVMKRGFVFVFPKIGRELFFQPRRPEQVTGMLNLSVGKVTLILIDGLFAGFFLTGIWITRKRWRELLILCYPYMYTLVTLAPFYLVGRNIMNVYFVVIILASVTFVHIVNRFKPATTNAL